MLVPNFILFVLFFGLFGTICDDLGALGMLIHPAKELAMT